MLARVQLSQLHFMARPSNANRTALPMSAISNTCFANSPFPKGKGDVTACARKHLYERASAIHSRVRADSAHAEGHADTSVSEDVEKLYSSSLTNAKD